MKLNRRAFGASLLAAALAVAAPSFASDHFAGKTITIVVGAGPGGFELHARVLSRHLGRFIPGNPSVVVQNMPGGGGLVAANHLFNIADKDGTVIGNTTQNIHVEELLGSNGVQFRTAEFAWVGRTAPSLTVTFSREGAPVTDIEQARAAPLRVGTTGVASSVYLFPRLMNLLLDTQFNLITGYPDTAAMLLALEQNEIEATTLQWDSLKSLRPDWVANGTLNYLVQHAPERHPELPDVPAIVELAANDDDRAILELFVSGATIGRAFMLPPGVPPEITEILRSAFDQMVLDPEFQADMAASNAELTPISGVDLQRIIEEAAYPQELLDRANEIRAAG